MKAEQLQSVPVLDLSAPRKTAVATLDIALRKFGFFYVKNHGIDASLVNRQFSIAEDLFALPLDAKTCMPFDSELDIGYLGSEGQALDPEEESQHGGDTKEQFMMTNNKLIVDDSAATDPNNVFEGSRNYSPAVTNHTEVSREYMSAAYKLNRRLNELLFDALGLGEQTRERLGAEPFLVLKQMRYAGDPSDPSNGKFGAGPHTDWGSFTILATDETPGLEIQFGDEWLGVPPRPDTLIINSGDQISFLTNGTYRSALHRVVTSSSKPRFSTAVFAYFGVNAEVGPLPQFISDDRPARYPSGRTSKEYFHFKLRQSMGGTFKV